MAGHSPTDLFHEARRGARELWVNRVPWRVYELPPAPFDRRGSSSLVFESEGAVRRVRNFPTNWRALNDNELFALSWAL